MTNQPKDNEWIEKARQQYSMCMSPKRHEIHCELFKQSILSNIPKPTEVVAPVDIDKIINDINKLYGIEEMIYQKEVKKIIRKHLKGTTPVEPINQERLSELIEHIIGDFFDRHRLSYSTFDVDNEYSKRKADELVPALREICWEYLGKSLQSENEVVQERCKHEKSKIIGTGTSGIMRQCIDCDKFWEE